VRAPVKCVQGCSGCIWGGKVCINPCCFGSGSCSTALSM